MKKFIVLFLTVFILSMNQIEAKKETYKELWKKVSKFESKSLPKSSLKEVDKIYNKARNERNWSQYIKALIHKVKYIQYVQEEALVKVQKELKKELKISPYPVRPMLYSMAAEMYWNYYKRNRWRILKRSDTAEIKDLDLRTWNLRKIVKEVVANYKKSLMNPQKLKKTKIGIFKEILIYGGYKQYRATLYDFLAHRAADFYMNSEAGLAQPVYQFTLNHKNYLKENNEFIKLKIESKDDLSFHFYALKILQDLIKFHYKSQNIKALVDVDLKRLKFIYNKAVIPNKGDIYSFLLKKMQKKYAKNPISSEISYLIADYYHKGIGAKYNSLISEKYKWYNKKAIKLCNSTIKKFPKAYGSNQCRALISRIKSRSIRLTMEKINVAKQVTRAKIDYKNVKKLYFRVYRRDKKERFGRYSYYSDKLVDYYLKNKKLIKSWNIKLIDDKDFRKHSTETKIPKLSFGEYVVITSSSKSFDRASFPVTYNFVTFTNISFVESKQNKKGYEFYLLHRETGAPLKSATIQVWYNKWNSKTRKYEYIKGKKFKTDKKGYANISYGMVSYSFYLEFIKGNDKVFWHRSFYLYKPHHYRRNKIKTFFFTDRSIYRPGQVVYYKGIMLEAKDDLHKKNDILTGYSTTVTYYDVNHQKINVQTQKTNEFGTFSGSFKIPTGRLNGRMRISNYYGNAYIQVEEYKRPKFEVKFQVSKKTYRVNDSVIAKGNAKALAGYNIDSAPVKYRVVRRAFFPYWWYYWGGYPTSSQMEITNGYTKTNAKGEFEIKFKAIPDLKLDKKSLPAFRYTIYADVTDLNGETRSASKTVSIGYTALMLNASIKNEVNREDKKIKLTINSTNLSGEFVPKKGNLKIYKLIGSKDLLRRRFWGRVDKKIISKKQYKKWFPYDEFGNESNVLNWKKGKVYLSKKFNTAQSKKIFLSYAKKWPVGKYVIEMNAVDRFKNKVKNIKHFTLYSNKIKKIPFKTFAWITSPKWYVEPGEKAEVLIGSSDKRVRVLYEIEHERKIVKRQFIYLNNEQKKVVVLVKEKHRGNFILHFTFIKRNRLYYKKQNITVPWTNKELKLSFETFRNKLIPGQKEEWRLKIKGKKGEKVAAEMLATLYDASLDAFRHHGWWMSVFPSLYSNHNWSNYYDFTSVSSRLLGKTYDSYPYHSRRYYEKLNWFGFYWYRGYYGGHRRKYKKRMAMNGKGTGAVEEKLAEADDERPAKEFAKTSMKKKSKELAVVKQDAFKDKAERKEESPKKSGLDKVKARTNFNETAFFYPHLRTNKNGEIIIAFTIPEALTKWKMLGLAHTKDLKVGTINNTLVTQKDLMVVPNAPRFLRENDKLFFTAKIANLAKKEIKGFVKLTFFDALTMKEINVHFKNKKPTIPFNVKKGRSYLAKWQIEVPETVQAVTYRIVAKAGRFSDGEEMVLPVLKNRMMVTESIPLPVRSKQTKKFTFKNLINSGQSKTLRHHKVTLEFTSNPAWYAVQALPYIMEYPYECTEQTFNRYYANSIAEHIVKKMPRIKKVFDQWKNEKNSGALLSNLEKNQELKSVLLQETPWVLNAKSETARKRRISLLFDLNKMADEMDRALRKVREAQLPSGGWSWFKGMRPSRYITTYLAVGFAHMHALGVIDAKKDPKISKMVKKALLYLDDLLRKDYEHLLALKVNMNLNHLYYSQIQYLYARSYFTNIPISSNNQIAFKYYKEQAKKFWMDYNYYSQGMIALAMNRYDEEDTAKDIVKSLKEHALYHEEMGMYWKNALGFYWYQAPIETQALLIEVFDEITGDAKAVDDMKTWLIKNKQTQDWRTTKATAEAIYALLLKGDNWLKENKLAEITLGKMKVDPYQMKDVKVEAGTGYFKTSWSGKDIKPEMGNITVKNNNNVVAWGALYWQYFEQLDKIKTHKTPLQLTKKLFIERTSATGPVLKPVKKGTKLKVGDRIKVRIILRVDRMMEYVHMKDMRASSFEPENVISRYKWQDGLGYYESTKDASTNFFIDYLPKGTFVFEYPLRVTHEGDFSNGITTIQCMYAPEFSSHSEGVRVKIGK